MKAINPVQQMRRRQPPPQLEQKIYFPKLINTLGNDPLLTPQNLPVGDVAHPFADPQFVFESGALVDVKQ